MKAKPRWSTQTRPPVFARANRLWSWSRRVPELCDSAPPRFAVSDDVAVGCDARKLIRSVMRACVLETIVDADEVTSSVQGFGSMGETSVRE